RLHQLGDANADAEQLAAAAVAFTHGLVVQALFDPDRFPVDVQTAMLDDFLASLGPGAGADRHLSRRPGLPGSAAG
ncbi:TetR family transcriptional regulator C-terminal domain-containing protein, partial [Streptomyces sp. NPDC049952]